LGRDQYGAPLWPGSAWLAAIGARAARALEGDDSGGRRCSGITAPCVFDGDGAINGERFRAYVEQMLAPTLRPDDIVLLDNLSSHKAAGVVEAITAQGAQLVYLPPYSSVLNPIEQAFARLKAALRRAAERTRDALWQTIGRILEHYQPQECRNLFNNAGYAI
jgi:transposase